MIVQVPDGGSAFAECRQIALPSPDDHAPLGEFVSLLRQTACARGYITHAHVRGHAGDLGNELCDALAKFSRRHREDLYDRCLPTWVSHWRRHPLCRWGWMSHLTAEDLPCLTALEPEAARLQRTIAEVSLPAQGLAQTQGEAAYVTFGFQVFSFNVLTMFDPSAPHGKSKRQANLGLLISGKRDLLKRQLRQQGVWLAGFQETRLPTSGTLPDGDYLMLSSGATDQGHGGCSLWIDRRVPYGYCDGKKLVIQDDQVTVIGRSSRFLEVLIEAPRLSLVILVAHGPRVAQQGEDTVRQFWKDRASVLLRRRAKTDYIILTDANAHLGAAPTESVNTFGAEPENLEGVIFHEFLLSVEGFLPSTSDLCHSGQHWTWAAPEAMNVHHRLDFIVIPQRWCQFELRSQVWHTFEALHARQDHLPVWMDIAFAHQLPPFQYTCSRKTVYRPTGQPTREQRCRFGAALQTMPRLPWDVDVDDHNALWVQQVQSAVQPFLPEKAEAAPTQVYLTAGTLGLVDSRRRLRQYIRAEEVEKTRRLLMVAFAAFRLFIVQASFTGQALRRASEWLIEIDYSIAYAVNILRDQTRAIRAAVRRDRLQYLDGLRDNISLQDMRNPKALYQAVRKAFPQARASRRRSFRPLPAVRLEDGTLATDKAARLARWERFFGEQEAAQIVTQADYLQAFADPDIPVSSQAPVFDLAALPTLMDLEQQLVALRNDKAAGPDGITAEVLKLNAASVARTLYPLCLKSALGVREPVDWRGGCLMALAKKASAALDCSAFRSILLANATAKVQHRMLRGKLLVPFAAYRGDVQAGQMTGIGVDSVGLIVRAYQMWARQKRMSTSLTFFDLKSAYYRVVRQTLFSAPEGREFDCLQSLLVDLGVPAEAFQELVGHLNNMAVLADANVSAHLSAQVADLFRGSWFRLQGGTAVLLTKRGTRPGDPLADLLFAYSFAACCKAIDTALLKEGLHTTMPGPMDEPPWQGWSTPAWAGLPAWADDFVFMQADRSAVVLCQKTCRAVEKIAAIVTSAGMQLTYDVDKTASLLSADCPRPVEDLVLLSEETGFCMPIRNPITGATHNMPVVDSYKHLGSIVVSGATPDVEIHYRFAQAQGILKALKSRLFSNAGIPLATRRTLLRALSVSKFVFSSATLHLTASVHRRTWARMYVELWRSLEKRTVADDQGHSYQILLRAGAPSPLLALAQARAVFFRRVLQHGPATLLHFLHAQWRTQPATSWLQQFHLDLKAVAVYATGAQTLLTAACPVQSLCEVMQEDPAWWPNQVRRAIRGYLSDLEAWGSKKPDAESPAPPPEADLPFVCPQCNAAFRLRKHLGVHMARSHNLVAPVRHFAADASCGGCSRWFHTLARVHNHLRHSVPCLVRLLHTMRPLTMLEIKEADALDKARSKKVKGGQWRAYQAALPAVPVFGPALPTYLEATQGLSEEDFTLDRMAKLYRPKPSTVAWIMDFVSGTSVEGPRAAAVDFWLTRPVSHHGPRSAAMPRAASTAQCFTSSANFGSRSTELS